MDGARHGNSKNQRGGKVDFGKIAPARIRLSITLAANALEILLGDGSGFQVRWSYKASWRWM
jgi:hypothetical protein